MIDGCPNLTLDFHKKLIDKLGIREFFRAWLEHEGEIPLSLLKDYKTSKYYKPADNSSAEELDDAGLFNYLNIHTAFTPVSSETEISITKDFYRELSTRNQYFKDTTVIGRIADVEIVNVLAAKILQIDQAFEEQGIEVSKRMASQDSRYNPYDLLKQYLRTHGETSEDEIIKSRIAQILQENEDGETEKFDALYDLTSEFLEKELGVSIDDDFEAIENSNITKDWDDKRVFNWSQKDNVNTAIKRLIMTAPELDSDDFTVDENGKKQYSTAKSTYLGLGKSLNFGKIFPYFQRNLSKGVDIDDMLRRLEVMSSIDPSILTIYHKVQENENLRNGFFTSFYTQKPDVSVHLVSPLYKSSNKDKANKQVNPETVLADSWNNTILNKTNEGVFPSETKATLQGLKNSLDRAKTDTERIALAVEIGDIIGLPLNKSTLEKFSTNPFISSQFNQYAIINGITDPLTKIVQAILTDKVTRKGSRAKRYNINVSGDIAKLATAISMYEYDLSEGSYLDTQGNLVNSYMQPNFLSTWFKEVKTAMDSTVDSKDAKEALKNKLLDYAKENAMLHSNWLGLGDFEGFLTRDNEDNLILNESYLKQIDYSYNGGIKNTDNQTGVQYDSMSDNDWHYNNLMDYLHTDRVAGQSKRGKRWITIPTPVASDSGNIMQLRVKRFTGDSLSIALHNTVLQELERFISARDLLFDIVQEPVTPTTSSAKLVVKANLDLSTLQYRYHFNSRDKDGNPILLDKNGKPTGNVFSFQNLSFIDRKGVYVEAGKVATINDILIGKENPISIVESILFNHDIPSEFEKVVKQFEELYIEAETEKAFNTFQKLRGQLRLSDEYKMYDDEALTDEEKKSPKAKELQAERDSKFKEFCKEFALNHHIHNVEIGNFFLGNIQEYKNFLDTNKRAKEIQSPAMRGLFKNATYNGAVVKDIELASKDYENILSGVAHSLSKSTSYKLSDFNLEKVKDVKQTKGKEFDALSDIEKAVLKIALPYSNTNIADGQGYMTLKRAKEILTAYGRWNSVYDNVFKKAENSEPLSSLELDRVLEIFKPFYYGREFDPATGRYRSNQIKYSCIPLIPAFVQGTDLEDVLKAMESKDVDELYFESAEKVGQTFVGEIANSKGNLKKDFAKSIKPKVFYNKNWGIQQDSVNHLVDYENKLGTQIQKIMIANLELEKEIYEINGEAPVKGADLISHYFRLIDANLEDKYKDLINEIGVQIDDNGTHYLKNDNSLSKIFAREIVKRGLSNNFKDALQETSEQDKSPKLPYSVNNLADKFESIVLSLFDNRIVNQKQAGGIVVMASNALLNYKKDQAKGLDDLTTAQKDGITWSKDNPDKKLSFTLNNAGKVSYTECLLPPFATSLYEEGQLINIDELDEDVRTMIGFRMPTETKHSCVVLKVVGFLPQSMGSAIVLPQEIVSQSGADFDIDKLFFLRKNFEKTKDGFRAVPYTTSMSEAAIKERFRRSGIELEQKRFMSEDFFEFAVKELKNTDIQYYEDGAKKYRNPDKTERASVIRRFLGRKYAGKITWVANAKTLLTEINKARYSDNHAGTEKTLAEVTNGLGAADAALLKQVMTAYNKKYRDEVVAPAYDDFKTWSIEKQNSREARENRILDIYKAIQTNAYHYAEILTSSSFETLSKLREKQDELMGKSDKINPNSYFGQVEFRQRNISGRDLKGKFVNYKGLVTIGQVSKMSLRDDIAFQVQYVITGKSAFKKLKDRYGDAMTTTKEHENGDITITIKHKNLGWNTDKSYTNVDGELITEQLAQTVANVLDIVKFPLPYNINNHTASTFAAMLMTGVPMDYACMYVAQPILTEYAQLKSSNEGVISEDKGYEISNIKRKYLTSLYRVMKYSGKLSANEQFEKKIEYYGSIDPDRDEIQQIFGYDPDKVYVTSADKLQRLMAFETKRQSWNDKKLGFKGLSSTDLEHLEAFYRAQLQILETFNTTYRKAGEAIEDGVKVFNTERKSVGPSLDNVLKLHENMHHIDTYSYDVDEVEIEGGENLKNYKGARLVIGKRSAVRAIYPSYFQGGLSPEMERLLPEDRDASAYPLLDSYYKYAYAPAFELFRGVFIRHSEAFINFRDKIADFSGGKLDDKTYKNLNKFLTAFISKDFRFFEKFHKPTVLGIDTEINLDKNIPLGEFVKLSAANQLQIVKERMGETLTDDIYHILNRLTPQLSESLVEEAGMHHINFKNTINNALIDDRIVESFSDMYFNQDPYIKTLGESLVAYSFFTTGFTYGFNSFSKYLPSNLLAHIGYGEHLKQKTNDVLSDSNYLIMQPNLIDTFFENNSSNRSLIPFVYRKVDEQGETMKGFPSWKPTWDETLYGMLIVPNNLLKKEGKKVANAGYLLVSYEEGGQKYKTLYKKVEVGTGKDSSSYYIPVNSKGNKFSVDFDSTFSPENMIKDEEFYLDVLATFKEAMAKEKESQSNEYYEGNIKAEPNTIFVFGSNPEGRHGKGAALIAVQQFGAKYGQGEGLQGNAYALPTKDLRVKENSGFKSISPTQITESIKKLYQVAKENPTKQFKIGYRNTTDKSLNGYTGLEMIDMFNNAGERPSNIIFSKEWVDTGKVNQPTEIKPKIDSSKKIENLKRGDIINFQLQEFLVERVKNEGIDVRDVNTGDVDFISTEDYINETQEQPTTKNINFLLNFSPTEIQEMKAMNFKDLEEYLSEKGHTQEEIGIIHEKLIC